jgi:hypothetical protein
MRSSAIPSLLSLLNTIGTNFFIAFMSWFIVYENKCKTEYEKPEYKYLNVSNINLIKLLLIQRKNKLN